MLAVLSWDIRRVSCLDFRDEDLRVDERYMMRGRSEGSPSVRHISNKRHCVPYPGAYAPGHAVQLPLAFTRGVRPGLCAPRPNSEPYDPRARSPRMTWDQGYPYTPLEEASSQA
jgi:hypothetical protein